MARTDRFRQQHNALLALASELQSLLDEEALAQDGTAARTCLSKLMGQLTMHLATEDKVLYPELQAHPDPAVAALAHRFATEMKSTTAAVVTYNNRWDTSRAIKENPRAFIHETKDVVFILTDRIKRENQELYASADRCEGQVY